MNQSDKKDKKNKDDKVKVPPIDCFFDTGYTANTVNKIHKIHKKIWFKCVCNCCTCYTVETRIVVQDTYNPTFSIQRKNFCTHCWLKKINEPLYW